MKYALVDGYSLIFRAFHAMKTDLSTSKGELTNAVFGFCNMLLVTLQRENPDGTAVAFDVGRAFRHDQYKEYKAHRAAMPEELVGQIARIRQVVDAFGFPTYEMEGYEADDVIGSLARRLEARGHEVVIITGDTDMLQLVTDAVSVATPNRGRFSEVRLYDPAEVRERYGFGPEYVADYKALVGDASDNVRGVPGVGEKIARTLITQFGDTESILEHIAEIQPERIRNAITQHQDQLRQSKHLCTIVTDLNVEEARLIENRSGYDRNSVETLFRELEFRTLLTRLPKDNNKQAETPTPVHTSPLPETDYTTLFTADEIRNAAEKLANYPYVAFDTETDDKSVVGAQLVGISLSGKEGEAYYIPVGHSESPANKDEVLDALRPLFAGTKPGKVAHNAKFDYTILLQHGLDTGHIEFDTSVAAFLLNETSVGLKDLAATRLGIDMTPIEKLIGKGRSKITMVDVPIENAAPYACADADMTLRLFHLFGKELKERNQYGLLHDLEMPLVPVLADMELAGITIDSDELRNLSKRLYDQLQAVESEIKEIAGYEFNLRSPQQLSKLLYGELGLRGTRKTATGYSTDVHALEALAGQHPIIEKILQYRQVAKLKDTYVDALPLMVNEQTGRLHTSFSQTNAITGRLVSTDPNLQNIPVRTQLGKEVRKAFIASDSPSSSIMPGSTVLLSCDYSQIELRVLAHITGEQSLREAFEKDEDIHALTAAQLYDVPLESVTPDMRRTGKTINFGIIYGMSGFRLARDTGLSQRKAAEFVSKYMEQYPAIRDFFDQTVKKATETGYVETPLGRRRYLPDLSSSNQQRREAARRAAINMPIQGTAADIIKKAMVGIHKGLLAKGFKSRMLLQVHDELLFEVPESELESVTQFVLDEMSSAVDLKVPLQADAKYGCNWGEMTPIARERG